MQLKSLKVFCDVVGWRSFSRAADENGISQSGASQVVHQLEQRLGVKLIDRSKRPFVLTPEGETYYEGCRKLVQRYDVLEDQVRTLHEEVAGRVRVVSIYSVGLHLMNRYLQQFLSQYPKANVRLEYQHPHRVYEAIEKDQADLGLLSYPRASRTIEAIGWREEPMLLVCAPHHRLASRPTVEFDDLNGENFIGFDSELTIRREIDRVLQIHGVEVQVVMEFDNVETMKRAVEIDAGVSFLPEPSVAREVAAGTLVAVPLAVDELVRPLGIIYRRGKELSSTTQRFIALLQSEGQTEVGDDLGEAAARLATSVAGGSGRNGSASNGDVSHSAHVAEGNGAEGYGAGGQHDGNGHDLAAAEKEKHSRKSSNGRGEGNPPREGTETSRVRVGAK